MSSKSTPHVDNLKFVKTLGSGSSSVVKLMEDTDGTSYALKVAGRKGSKVIQGYQNEYNILRTLEQAGVRDFVPKVYSLLLNGKESVMLMEALGKSLAEEMEEKGYYFSEKEAIQIGLEMLSHVRKLHGVGVTHGDIQPWNTVRRGVRTKGFKNLCLIDFEESFAHTGYKEDKSHSTAKEDSIRFNKCCRWDVSLILTSVTLLAGAEGIEPRSRLQELEDDVNRYLTLLKKIERAKNVDTQDGSAGVVDYEFVRKLMSAAESSTESLRSEPRKIVK